MHRLYFLLAAFVSVTTMPFTALAETAAEPATADTQIRHLNPVANDAGFYIDLPTVNSRQLVGLIRAYRTSLSHRQQKIQHYLEENRLDTGDMLIAIILPVGLLYAAVRKGNLEQAKVELAEMTADRDELTRDLLAMQAVAENLQWLSYSNQPLLIHWIKGVGDNSQSLSFVTDPFSINTGIICTLTEFIEGTQ